MVRIVSTPHGYVISTSIGAVECRIYLSYYEPDDYHVMVVVEKRLSYSLGYGQLSYKRLYIEHSFYGEPAKYRYIKLLQQIRKLGKQVGK